MPQNAAPEPAPGVLTETSSHIVGDLTITYRINESAESLDPATTLGFLDLRMTGPRPDGLPAEVQIETDADGCLISYCLDYSAVDVLAAKACELRGALRPEVTA